MAEKETALFLYQLEPSRALNPTIKGLLQNPLIIICSFLFQFVLFNGIFYGTISDITETFADGGHNAEKSKKLSALEVKRLSTPGRHAVGIIPGLLLVVKDTGAKSWILRTMVGDRRRNLGLGGYPAVSLAEACKKAKDVKNLIQQGLDPVEEKRAKK